MVGSPVLVGRIYPIAAARVNIAMRVFALPIRYALTRCTTDDRLDICNNAAERAIRPLALGPFPRRQLDVVVTPMTICDDCRMG